MACVLEKRARCRWDVHSDLQNPPPGYWKSLVVWRVCGRITGEEANTLRALLEEESGPSALDFKDVRLVDGGAVRLLALLESNGAKINNCPRYIREWIRRESGGI